MPLLVHGPMTYGSIYPVNPRRVVALVHIPQHANAIRRLSVVMAGTGGSTGRPAGCAMVQRGGAQDFIDYSPETVQDWSASMGKWSSESAARPPADSPQLDEAKGERWF